VVKIDSLLTELLKGVNFLDRMVYMLAKTYRPSGVSPKRLATAETYRFIFHRDS